MDKNKVIQNAQKFIQKGQLDKAIKEYEKVLQADPSDVRSRLKIGDLQAKKGDNRGAAETYILVAESYGQQGFFLKAVAVYKQILKLDPDRVEVNLKLAELYHQLGLMSDAMAQYQSVAAYYERTGNNRASFDTLRRMLDLDPDNVASRIKLAEMYSKEGMVAEAVQEFRNAATYLKERNRIDDYIKVCERLIYHQPDDIPLTRELANIYLTKGDTKRSLAKLQVCFKSDPQDVETLHLLARAFLDLGQANKTISVYKELAKIYADNGQIDEQRDAWNKVLSLAPDDPEALAATGRAPAPAAAVPAAGPPPGAMAPPAGRPPGAGGAAAAPPQQDPADVTRLLTETDVYVKYGLKDKALEHLKKVFGVDPNSIPGHEKAKDLYKDSGDMQSAGAELVTLIALTKDTRPDQAREYLSEIMNIAPHLPEVQGFIAQLGQPEVESISFLDQGTAVVEDEVILAGDDEDEFLVAEDEDFGADDDDDFGDDGLPVDVGSHDEGDTFQVAADDEFAVEDDEGHFAVADDDEDFGVDEDADFSVDHGVEVEEEDFLEDDFAAPSAADEFDDDLDGDLDDDLDSGVDLDSAPGDFDFEDETQTTEMLSVKDLPELEDVRKGYAGGDFELDDEPELTAPGDDPFAIPDDDGGFEPVVEPQGTEIARGGPRKTPEEIADELEEAEFFIQQGLPDEAAEVLANILAADPGNAEALRLQSQLEADEDEEADDFSAPSLDHPGETDGLGGEAFDDFDLAGELADELADLDDNSAAAPIDDLQVSADDVFSEFKKGVAEAVSKDDADTHYDLGIAYREMGLVADAIGEFELAANSPAKRIDALTNIGTCQKELGQFEAAIEAFKQALMDEKATAETEKAIYYELGELGVAMDDAEEARFYFKKVAEMDPKYRDVKERLAGLGGGGKSRNGVAGDDDDGSDGGGGSGAARSTRKPGKVDYV
ncbi:MAG: tetratricopeptide repeat protein [Deltaproteobacteria bacterium]|nr:tetratricopeptide repeat protein [Deltaproteobacteria bacterium]